MAISDSAQVDECITFEVNARLMLLFLQFAFSAFFVLQSFNLLAGCKDFLKSETRAFHPPIHQSINPLIH